MMTQEQDKIIKKAIKNLLKMVKTNPEIIDKCLVDAGIYTADGKLTRNYC